MRLERGDLWLGDLLGRHGGAPRRRPGRPGRPGGDPDERRHDIKTSAFQVWPREIEEVLAAHPAVAEVGVAGIPHQVRGEVAKAWVVLRRALTAGDPPAAAT